MVNAFTNLRFLFFFFINTFFSLVIISKVFFLVTKGIRMTYMGLMVGGGTIFVVVLVEGVVMVSGSGIVLVMDSRIVLTMASRSGAEEDADLDN